MEALEKASGRTPRQRLRVDRSHAARPSHRRLLAVPPKLSGISDYTSSLIDHLKSDYAIDLYHDIGYVPEQGLGSHEFGCHDYRLFDRHAGLFDYRAVLYQMGNSVYHKFVYDTLLNHPGIVTLHDFCLSAFQYWYAHLPGAAPDYFQRQIEHFAPDRAAEYLEQLGEWSLSPGGIQVSCARHGLYLNRRVFELAENVIVHSPWCVDRVRALFPEHEPRTAVIPHGSTAEVISPARRAATRAARPPAGRADLRQLRHPLEGQDERRGHRGLRAAGPDHAVFAVHLRGPGLGGRQGARKAEELGLEGQVRFLGRQSAADFVELIGATDVGVSLRLPPTDGETSGALLHVLRLGVPAIVTDVGTFSGYPDSIVRKVRWHGRGDRRAASSDVRARRRRARRRPSGGRPGPTSPSDMPGPGRRRCMRKSSSGATQRGECGSMEAEPASRRASTRCRHRRCRPRDPEIVR